MPALRQLVVVCDNIRSVYNVGSIFRTADGAGISKIYLCGITPCPPRPDIHKVALGAEESVLFEHVPRGVTLARRLKKKGYHLVALENNVADSIDYRSALVRFPSALILGGEVDGIAPDILKLCEYTVHIPMRGVKESLNVSVAFGIIAYHILAGG